MHTRIRTLTAAAFALALTCSMANAQLLLSGHTTGSFTDLSEPDTTVTNAPDGSWASFHTGIPYGGSTQSKIEFTNVAFANVGYGDPIQVGLFDITNGMTLVGSGAPTAQFNIGIDLTSPVMQAFAVSTIMFHIDHTPNGTEGVPDLFAVTFDQPPPVHVGDFLVQFHVHVTDPIFQVDENSTVQKGDITVTFTPVPEPSTYAAIGAALLVGVIGFRRFRGSRPLSGLPTAA